MEKQDLSMRNGKDGISGFAIDDVTNEEYISDNDYIYYFSVEFSKF